MSTINAGLFGFGCVGQGLFHALNSKRAENLPVRLTKVCVKDAEKTRIIQRPLLTFEKNDILEDDDIQLVIELISDADEAFELVKTAMSKGKAVVSANKKMIAEHLPELIALQRTYQTPFLYEASVCGSIPVIRLLDEQYGNDEVYSIETIANGTCNFILTHLFKGPNSYEEVLADAQQKGFAEEDPYLDVSGYDSKYKLAILLAHTFGAIVKPADIVHFGISTIRADDIQFALNQYGIFRLVGKAFVHEGKLVSYVLPHLVKADHEFYHVDLENNAVRTHALFADRQTLVGKGAGSFPTASAVLADIADALRFKTYSLNKIDNLLKLPIHTQHSVKVYLRFDNKKVLEELEPLKIHQQGRNYIIADISLQQLTDFKLSERKDVFVAVIS